MRCLIKLYRKRVDNGRVLLHEQPAHAKSWMTPEIRSMMREAGVTVVEADQCMYGLKTWGPTGERCARQEANGAHDELEDARI